MFRDTYEKVLSPELLRDLEGLRVKNEDDFRFLTEYWAKCVYSFATAFKKKPDVKERNNLLEALRILWMGKVASFILESFEFDEREAEEKIEEEADVFEKIKPYLLDIY